MHASHWAEIDSIHKIRVKFASAWESSVIWRRKREGRSQGSSTASAASWLWTQLVAKQPHSDTVWYCMQGFTSWVSSHFQRVHDIVWFWRFSLYDLCTLSHSPTHKCILLYIAQLTKNDYVTDLGYCVCQLALVKFVLVIIIHWHSFFVGTSSHTSMVHTGEDGHSFFQLCS